ncbi:hypothetical protein Syun_023683 [Stephania yunnanensis]|uniref:GDT1 family protein n=1 Tax=Stephania yunnanensis TaxID=152371 RepID=A0AAP0FJ88_9MAGN
MSGNGYSRMESEYVHRHHNHETRENQCSSYVVKHIKAPVHLVWSLVRRFDQPQKYKPFISRCVMQGDPVIGSLREVNVKSGLPATTSTERLELLDDEAHILSIRIVGGDHRLKIEDETFIIAALMAMRHPKSIVLSGALAALIVMTVLSTGLGRIVPNLISRKHTNSLYTVYLCSSLLVYRTCGYAFSDQSIMVS